VTVAGAMLARARVRDGGGRDACARVTVAGAMLARARVCDGGGRDACVRTSLVVGLTSRWRFFWPRRVSSRVALCQ